ncbi:MAG: ribosome biogenesis GTPase Der [Spirochaetales bacterium]|nr:ribosome biogenesis GTPase Der [Spirochaetales bacterium]
MAVVGRPNVGKSTLFNRMVGKRRSITDPTPGVTRDPVEAVCELDGHKVLVIDTGGYKPASRNIDKQVNEKSLAALERAEIILFLMEITEVTPEDEAFAQVLRKYSDRVFLIVNKMDNEQREQDIWDFHSFGFAGVFGISAEHGRNFGELIEYVIGQIDFDKFDNSNQQEDDCTIAVLGKPNTGKSTLTNALLGGDYSIVSDIPGTTRDVLEGVFEYGGKRFRLLDTAGIRRKSKVGENIEYYSVSRAIDSINQANIVFLMIDSPEGLTDQDKKIAQQIVNKGKGLIIVLNKWDLLENKANQYQAMCDRVRFVFPVLSFAPIMAISARDKTGLDILLDCAIRIKEQLVKRIDTGVLNRAMQRWIDETPPPSGKKRFKLRYITQRSKEPVIFMISVNKEKGFPSFYASYIKNRIRAEFGFEDIPVQIDLKET